MAVVLTYPADPGQLGKNAAGVVAAFTATGYQNEGSGLTVTITDETLGGRILGSGASNTDPEPSGTYAGWWAFSVYCPAFDSTGASIVYLESAAAAIASAASLRVRSAAAVSGTAADSSASTETAEGYTGATSEVVLSYADGSARLRAIVGDAFSSAAADASAGAVSSPSSGISYVGAGTFAQRFGQTALSVEYPAGIQSGDLLVLAANGGWNAVPAGWTTINSDATSFVAFKFHTSGTSVSVDAYDDGEGGAYSLACRVYAWRGVHATPVDVKSPSSGFTLSANSTTHTGASLSPLSDSMLVLIDFSSGNAAATGASGGIDTHVAANSANGSINMGYDSTPSGGTTAPALTYGSSFASYLLTLALRKA